jgi:hypothetical protein
VMAARELRITSNLPGSGEACRPGRPVLRWLRKGLHQVLAESLSTDAKVDGVVSHSDGCLSPLHRAQANQKQIARTAIAKCRRKPRRRRVMHARRK